ncbi:MAG: serine/threonine protein kinase [Anaerolineales bacterium]|nr:serine/threonine protein kinase [Anaerolineales bacterium]
MTFTDPLIGKQLANFRIERVLGRGGMAQVYYGQDIKLQRPVAIKVIDARYRDNPQYARRFVTEARAVARWRHENIIQIYYADDQDGLYYYVMEYIDGPDLASVLNAYATRGEKLPPAEVLRIGKAIASALDYAHKHGIIHRDVKPSNVFLSKDGRVVLGDFGLALDVNQGSSGEAFGSPHYISPEQARRSTDATPLSDLYSLGVILYEMLTGVVPFDDLSPTSVALQHLTQEPPPPRSLNPQLNAATEAVLLKALSKNPQERYPSGAALMEALEQALAQPASTQEHILPLPPLPAAVLGGKTRPVTRKILPATSPPKRRRGPLYLFLLLLALFALLFFGNLQRQGGFPALFPFLAPIPTPTPTWTSLPTATASPSPSMTASQTASPTATHTLTPRPSATLTASATSTSAATTTSTPSLTLTSTTLPSATSITATPTPATAPPSTPATPTTTPPFPNLKRMWLYYDEYGFYIYNASPDNRSISPIAFERLDGSNRFGGFLWAEFYATLHPGRCMRIEIQKNPGNYLNPPLCRNYYLSTRSITRDSDLIFWTAQPNNDRFRVLWQNQEVGLCTIADGFCEVFIP